MRKSQSPTRISAIALLLLVPPRLGMTQDPTSGDRIRIVRAGNPTLVGRFLRMSGDSLWLATSDRSQPRLVALGEALRVERSLGRRSHTLTGALVGAGVGAGITLLFLNSFCGGDNLCNGDEEVRAAAILGLPCVALGAGIGALIRTERWTPLQLGHGRSGMTLQVGIVLR